MPSETRGGRHLTHCSLTLGFPSSMDYITRSGGGFKMSPTFHFHRKFIGLLQQQGGEWEVVTEAGVAVEICGALEARMRVCLLYASSCNSHEDVLMSKATRTSS